MDEKIILQGGLLCTPNKILQDHILVIENKIITAILPSHFISHHLPAKILCFDQDHYISRGFLDLHIHGIQGVDVMDANIVSLEKMAIALAQNGVTGFLATTMTSSEEILEQVIDAVLAYQKKPHPKGARCLGLHLEGPFISEEQAGAQLAHQSVLPNIELFLKMQKRAEQQIKRITLAPELTGALECIQAIHAAGCAISIGHTHADFATTKAAIAAGATQATHLFNAMRGFHHREPGALGALLLSNEIEAELIVDAFHLHPASVELAFKLKGLKNLCLVSDAMRACQLSDGTYELGGQSVLVKNGKATLANGQLAGSTLKLTDALIAFCHHTGTPIEKALTLVTANPARWLNQERELGLLEIGVSADLCIFKNDGSVWLSMHAGEILFSRGNDKAKP